jgi:hypothetical protein
MKTNFRYKFQHVLLAVFVLLNPIMVSADGMFSAHNAPTPSESTATELTQSFANQLNGKIERASCHDEMQPNSTAISKRSTQDAQQVTEDVSNDCCEESCSCSATSCHSTSAATISSTRSLPPAGQSSATYAPNYYLSYIPTPSFPPPIA